eukprot:1043065-Prorocentrum_minimum.AAC.1
MESSRMSRMMFTKTIPPMAALMLGENRLRSVLTIGRFGDDELEVQKSVNGSDGVGMTLSG